MANEARNAILRALIEGVLVDLMVKTSVSNVYVDTSTTLATKLSEIVTSLNTKASTDALNQRPTTSEMEAAISTAVSNLVAGAPETYNTLKELADYISEHEDVVTAINEAIGGKADKSTVQGIQTTVNALGALSKKSLVSESDLDAALKEKVNAASEGNHSHNNKNVLDSITTENVVDWNGKCKFYAQESRPSNMTANDLWAQLI